MRHDPPDQAARYRGVVTKLLLSDLIAMGHPEILDAVCYMLRVGGSYLLVVAVRGFWRWVLREQSREVRMCYQAEDEAWCEIETW